MCAAAAQRCVVASSVRPAAANSQQIDRARRSAGNVGQIRSSDELSVDAVKTPPNLMKTSPNTEEVAYSDTGYSDTV